MLHYCIWMYLPTRLFKKVILYDVIGTRCFLSRRVSDILVYFSGENSSSCLASTYEGQQN